MPSSPRRTPLWIAALLLLVPIALLQTKIDPLRHQYEPGSKNTGRAVSQLPIEFALGAATGFREAVAGLLWVRTDEFFHNGDYDAITPMIRIITWLDPHQIDVYETGAWHMDYNFTDSSQRSDRRYIPLSLALMNEGIANNPTVSDMRSDLGFTHYFRKIADFPKAAQTFAAGQAMTQDLWNRSLAHPDDSELHQQAIDGRTSVIGLGHGLAHALEAQGKIPEALAQWQYCVATHQDNITRGIGTQFNEQGTLENAQKQLYEMNQRAKWRARDTKVPVDAGFNAQVERVAPKIFVVRGTMNIIGNTDTTPGFLETGRATWGPVDGCRVEVRVQDLGYTKPIINSFSLSTLNLDPNITIMQDAMSVRKGVFERKIDMSQDPAMYSFTAPRYAVTFWFNPANPNDCPPNAQDRIGWRGEGLTDKHFLDTSGIIPGDTAAPVPGVRLLRKTIVMTREDFLGQGDKVFN